MLSREIESQKVFPLTLSRHCSIRASKQPFDPRPIMLDHIHPVTLSKSALLPEPLTVVFHQRRNEVLGFRKNEDIRILKVAILRQALVCFSGHRRGGKAPLSDSECSEILQSRISYYQNDLAVIGWNCAFVYDTAAGAETARELLEYANSQLLEFRHYDELLSRELKSVYRSLETGTGIVGRWKLAR